MHHHVYTGSQAESVLLYRPRLLMRHLRAAKQILITRMMMMSEQRRQVADELCVGRVERSIDGEAEIVQSKTLNLHQK
jgi:hypothetical protein